MSHVATVTVRIKDLKAAAKAAKACGMRLVQGQKTWKWWGRWMRDYHGADAAYKHGIKPEDYGKCEHALVKDGGQIGMGYEAGLVKVPGAEGYRLVWDFVDRDLTERLGGRACEKFQQEYALAVAEQEAEEYTLQGWSVNRVVQPNGDIQLVLEQ